MEEQVVGPYFQVIDILVAADIKLTREDTLETVELIVLI